MAVADAERYSTVPEVYRWCQMEEDLAEMHGRSATLSLPGFSTSSHHLLYSGYLGHRSGSPDSYSPTALEARDFKCEGLVCQWQPRSFLRMLKPCDARESAICADICRSTPQQSGQTACSECDFLEKATAITPAGSHTPKDPTHTYAIAFTSMADGRSFEYTRSSRATPSRSFASAWLNRNSPYHQPAILHRVPCRYSTVSERGRSPKTLLGYS